MTPSTENGSQMLPEAAGVKDMSLVERVARAIIAANERRERSATHGMEIVAEAALEASGHAELVEQNRRLLWLVANLEPLCVNPTDGAPFEDGEVPYIDEARTIIRLNEDVLLREAGVRFLDDMAAKHTGEQS